MDTKRTPNFYMANLGAEVSRALSCRDSGDDVGLVNAIERSLGIIQNVMNFDEMKPREEEIKILRNVIEKLADKSNFFYFKDGENLKNYFYPFALRMMIV